MHLELHKNEVIQKPSDYLTALKKTEIYYLDNMKIHNDQLEGFGSFVEIKAKQVSDMTEEDQYRQWHGLLDEFGISKGDLISGSYSDYD